MAVSHYLVFTLDDQSYALALDVVDRVIRAVHLTPVPNAPGILLGLINIHGMMVPVLNIRKRFGLPCRGVDIEDRLIVCKTASRPIAIVVDRTEEVAEFDPDEMHEVGNALPDMEDRVEGVAIFRDHTVLIYDIERLFSSDDIGPLTAKAGRTRNPMSSLSSKLKAESSKRAG